MENASKALIIAGAILLAIVIISLGLIVVNNVRETTDNTNLTEQEIQSFNAKFIPYEGNNVSGSRVNTLIQQVISTNQITLDAERDNFIMISFPSVSGKYLGLTIKNKNLWYNPFAPNNTIDAIYGQISNTGSPWNKGQTSNDNFSFTVDTRKTYTVALRYADGVVKYIIVK